MTKQQAFAKARKMSKSSPYAFVFYEDYEYHPASEYEADTWFDGSEPVAVFSGGELVE